MKTQGLDRVAILVQDLDRARKFFAEALGIELTECRSPQLEAGGVRVAMSFDAHIELAAPVRPLPDNCPEITRQMAAALDAAGTEALLFGLTFKVKDVDKTLGEAAQEGIGITRRFDQNAIPELAVRDFKEIFLDPKFSLGLGIGLTSFTAAE